MTIDKVIQQLQYAIIDNVLDEKQYKAVKEAINMLNDLDRIKSDRDAAVSDLYYLATDSNVPVEKLCKYWTEHGCCCYDENYIKIKDCPGWEWRKI